MATKKQESEVIVIPKLDIRTLNFKCVGDTPLLMNAWDEKVKQELLDKMMGKAKAKLRDLKDPFREFIYSMYWLDCEKKRWYPEDVTEENIMEVINSGMVTFGFPSIGFKASAAAGAYRSKATKNKVDVYGALYIVGEFVEIKGIPVMRSDMVRVLNGAPDIRFRGFFPKWEADLQIRFNAGVFSAEQVASLFNFGGFAVGVGEWRPDKRGQFGMYHVE